MMVFPLIIFLSISAIAGTRALDLKKFTELSFDNKIDLKAPAINQMLSAFDENKYDALRKVALKDRLDEVCKSSKSLCEREKEMNLESDAAWKAILIEAQEKKSLEHQIFLGLYTRLREQKISKEKQQAFTDLSFILLTTWENRLKKIQPDKSFKSRALALAEFF